MSSTHLPSSKASRASESGYMSNDSFSNLATRTRRERYSAPYLETSYREEQRNSASTFSHDQRHILRRATKDDLLDARNAAYTGLLDDHKELLARYKEIRASEGRLMDMLSARGSSSADQLSSKGKGKISRASKPTTSDELDHESYPQIQFWTRDAYNAHLSKKKQEKSVMDPDTAPMRGSGRIVAGENVATDYIETENGQIITARTAQAIRALMKSIWTEIDTSDSMILPQTWSNVGLPERKYIFKNLYEEYPYVEYCEGHWKAVYLAGRTLTSYLSTGKKKKSKAIVKQEVKAEPVKLEVKAEPIESSYNLKRKPSSPLEGASLSKRAKIAHATASIQPSTSSPIYIPSSPDSISSPLRPIQPPKKLICRAPPVSPTPPKPPVVRPPGHKLRRYGEPLPSAAAPEMPATSPPTTPIVMPVPEPISTSMPTSSALVRSSNTTSPMPRLPEAANSNKADEGCGVVHSEERSRSEKKLVSPFDVVFGPAAGPSTRLKSLQNEKVQKPPVNTTKAAVVPEMQSGDAAEAKVSLVGKKRTNKTQSAKNLFYIDYLKTHSPITVGRFDIIWKGLGKKEHQKWAALSLSAKTAAGGVEGGIEDESQK